MSIGELNVTLVQTDTVWHDPSANRDRIAREIGEKGAASDVIVLPETFTTGFSNEAVSTAEDMDGESVRWLLAQARASDAAITGSVQIRVGARVFNRLLWAMPDGTLLTYDKRHLFRMAREQERYAAGRTARRAQGMAHLSARLLRPALPGVLAQSRRSRARGRPRLRPPALRRQLARRAPRGLAHVAARPGDREPLLCGRRQPMRHRRQRPSVCGGQRGHRLPRSAGRRV
jgi:hypothetical protein